jgi:hypothetical protein
MTEESRLGKLKLICAAAGITVVLISVVLTAVITRNYDKAHAFEELPELVPTMAPELPQPAKIPPVAGTAWKTEGGSYFFMKDGKSCYFISEELSDYICFNTGINSISREELLKSPGAMLADMISDGEYYRIDAVVEKELYFDTVKSGMRYALYIAVKDDRAAIYDPGWEAAYTAEAREMESIPKLEEYLKESGEQEWKRHF